MDPKFIAMVTYVTHAMKKEKKKKWLSRVYASREKGMPKVQNPRDHIHIHL